MKIKKIPKTPTAKYVIYLNMGCDIILITASGFA